MQVQERLLLIVVGLNFHIPSFLLQHVEQHALQRIHVRSGWPHQVFNMAAAIKIAWDFLDPLKIDLYHWHHQTLLSQIVSEHSKQGAREVVSDYVGVADVIATHLMDEVALDMAARKA